MLDTAPPQAVPGAGSVAQRPSMQTKGASHACPVDVERHTSPCPPPVVQRRMHGWPLQLVVRSEQSALESHAALTPAAGRVTSLQALVLPMGLEPLQVALASWLRQVCAFAASRVEAPIRTPRSVASPPKLPVLRAMYGRNTAKQSAVEPPGSWPHSMTFAQYALAKPSRNAPYVPVPEVPPPVPEVPPPAAPAPELEDMHEPDTQLSSMRHVEQMEPFVPQVLEAES